MHTTTLRLVAAFTLLAGCSTTVDPASVAGKTSKSSTSTPKTSASKKPTSPAPSMTVVTEQQTTVVAPLRDGHALKFTGMTPATGITLAVTGNGSATQLTYTPDPPDVKITLEVPDTSLGSKLTAATIAYTVDGQPAKFPAVQMPLAPMFIQPFQPAPIDIPIGTGQIRGLFQGDQRPTTLSATVSFINDAGEPIPDEKGTPLQVEVPIVVM